MPEIDKLIASFDDPKVLELMINPDGAVYAETAGKGMERLLTAPTPAEIAQFVGRLTGESMAFGPDRPYADLVAVDGSRVHVVAAPLARGLTVTVRKRPQKRPSLEELVEGKMLTAPCAGFLAYCVEQKQNILVVGGTSSGKTTFLSSLAAFAGENERIVVLEDTPELSLPQKHTLYLRTRAKDVHGRPDITLRELVVNTLRMRPDRVIVGETRGPEAADMLQAMNVGVEGMLSTLHANSCREAVQRLETLVLQAGIDMPLKAVRNNIVSAVDFIVFLARLADGSRRVIEVAEITGMEGDTITMAKLYERRVQRSAAGIAGELRATGTIPRFFERIKEQGGQPPIEAFRSEH